MQDSEPWKMENTQDEPLITFAHWEHFQAVAEGKGNQEDPRRLAKLKRQSGNSGRTGGKNFQGQVLQKKRAMWRKNSENLQSVLLENSA